MKGTILKEISVNSEDIAGSISNFWNFLPRYRREDAITNELNVILFYSLFLAQQSEGVRGDFLEIGVWRGGTFALACAGLRQNEIGYAADVFDLYPHPPNNNPVLFFETVIRIGLQPGRFKMLRVDTRRPEGRSLVSEQVRRNCRFVHIDGGHRAVNVRHDLAVAMDAVRDVPGAIVVLDDFMDFRMPEVTEETLAFLSGQDEFLPFLLSDRKIFLARAPYCAVYAKYAGSLANQHLVDDVRYIRKSPCLVFAPGEGTAGIQRVDAAGLAAIRRAPWEYPMLPEDER